MFHTTFVDFIRKSLSFCCLFVLLLLLFCTFMSCLLKVNRLDFQRQKKRQKRHEKVLTLFLMLTRTASPSRQHNERWHDRDLDYCRPASHRHYCNNMRIHRALPICLSCHRATTLAFQPDTHGNKAERTPIRTIYF
jgi:hypothetical protein